MLSEEGLHLHMCRSVYPPAISHSEAGVSASEGEAIIARMWADASTITRLAAESMNVPKCRQQTISVYVY